MSTARELLTQEEIEELTKAKQPGRQADILNEHGIYFIKRMDGSIVTTWHHVNHPARRHVANDSMPDFGAIA